MNGRSSPTRDPVSRGVGPRRQRRAGPPGKPRAFVPRAAAGDTPARANPEKPEELVQVSLCDWQPGKEGPWSRLSRPLTSVQLAPAWKRGGARDPRHPLGAWCELPGEPPSAFRQPMGAVRGRGVGSVGRGRAAEAAEVAAGALVAGAAGMAKSSRENGPRAPAAGGSLSGTRESLAQGPDAATTDELSSVGSDSEANGFADRRIDKFGFIVGSQGAEGA